MTRAILARLATGAALGALALAPLSAVAQQDQAPPEAAAGPDHAARAAAMVRLFDADADGLLSADEIEAGMAALVDLHGFGMHGGGSMMGREAMRSRGRDDARARGSERGWGDGRGMQRMDPARAFEQMDADGDGMISRAEWEAATERWFGMRSGEMRGGQMNRGEMNRGGMRRPTVQE